VISKSFFNTATDQNLISEKNSSVTSRKRQIEIISLALSNCQWHMIAIHLVTVLPVQLEVTWQRCTGDTMIIVTEAHTLK
jgi:hypothetical protein